MDVEVREALERLATRGEAAGGVELVARAQAEARGLGSVPVAPVDRRRHRPVRVVIAALAAASVLAVALLGGGLLYARAKLGEVERLDLAGALTAGASRARGPMTVLVVGSDSRAGLSADDQRRFGSADDVAEARADTIMVVRLDPGAGTAAALSLPRDLFVPIAGRPDEARINTALAGGPAALIRTVESALGIPLDHYVQVDLTGFRRMVDAVGGVSVSFPAPSRDRVTGLDVPSAGCRELDGEEALAFVRSRRLEVLREGRWQSDPTGDLGRIRRQQDFVLGALADAGGARNPLTLARLLDAAADHLTIDDGLSTGDLLDLGRRLASVGRNDVRVVSVPTVPVEVGGAAVLRADPVALLAAGAELVDAPPPVAADGAVPSSTPPPDVADGGC